MWSIEPLPLRRQPELEALAPLLLKPMAAIRIRISRLLSADERATLTEFFGTPQIGSTEAHEWAWDLIDRELARLVDAREHRRRTDDTRYCDTPACVLTPGHSGDHLVRGVSPCPHVLKSKNGKRQWHCKLTLGHGMPHVGIEDKEPTP
mgnify:CR=1 FL=1